MTGDPSIIEPDAATEPAPADLRLAPVALAAWVAMWVATSGIGWLIPMVAVAVAVLLALARRRSSWTLFAVALVLAVALGIGLVRGAERHTGTVPELGATGSSARAELELTADPRLGTGASAYAHARAEVRWVERNGRRTEVRDPVVLVVTGSSTEELVGLPVGTRLQAPVRWAGTAPSDDIAAIARTRGPLVIGAGPGPGLRLVERVRDGLRDSLTGAPAPQRALVPALVLGDTSAMTPELRESFVRTGLTHLTAVSGANLTYLLVFLTVAARAVGVRGRWLQVIGLLGVLVFVALCRTEPSVLRAAAMGLVTLAALSVVGAPVRGAPRRGVRHLSMAVLALVLIDPWLSRSVGFVLSVAASAGIILWSSGWTDTVASWLPRPLAEAIAVPLAAQLATQPVVTAISGEVSLVGLVANALAAPAVGPATVLGFAAAGAALVHPLLAGPLAFAAGWCAQVVIWVAEHGARLPGAAVEFPTSAAALVWLVAVVAVAAPLIGRLLSHRWAVLGMAVVMVLAVVRGPVPPGWPPAGWVVVACDVGQGDAFVLRAAEGQAIVVDTGPEPAHLRRCLSELGVRRVPLLVLSHYHADHIGGLAGLDGLPVDLVVVSPLASPAGDVARVQRTYAGRVRTAEPGQRLRIGEVEWTTLGPRWVPRAPATSDGESSMENDSSVSGIAEVDGVRILFTGDLTALGQSLLPDADVDVIKVAHHGSADFDPSLYTRGPARIAVIGVGRDNGYGHPAPSLLRVLHQHRLTVARTDEHGSVAVVRQDNELLVISRNP